MGRNLPVPVGSIAQALNIELVEKNDIHYSGSIQKNRKGEVICEFNAHEPITRNRFTVAHEVGHFVLGHIEIGKKLKDERFANTTQEERDANTFAAELLMPTEIVNGLIEIKHMTDVDELAQMFSVSSEALMYRLKHLGWLKW